jgi:glycosyltransferase involved in cell wall biosynthesis
MKLLVSAYACAPNHGSDHAVGWNWTTEAHRQGFQIWALVSPTHHDSITRACRENPDLAGIKWSFPTVPGWKLKQASEPKWERTYNLLWQRAALRHARLLHRQVNFDAVHHVTWGGIRAPTFLGALGIPLFIGPIGGCETSPLSLRDELGRRGRLLEWIRDATTATTTLNPLIAPGLRSATAIFAYTRDTQDLFSGSIQKKTMVFSAVSIQQLPSVRLRHELSKPPKFLYAGRLLYWKGVHIALRAISELNRLTPGARFTIVGNGPERQRLLADVDRLGLHSQVEFISRLPQPQLFELYQSHDLLLFPSLHDSGGFVVIEALSRGMPVVCLDLGGPRDLVTPASGIVVQTKGRNTREVAEDMAQEIHRVITTSGKLQELSAGAIARAAEFVLEERVRAFYGLALSAMGTSSRNSAPTVGSTEVVRGA